ncbi:MAG TPA: tRNA epoxyqueuosine(34) reductase QueG [Acidobacteriaceae bacterium]|jgi:epoxyqueuosine reductase|nr:tRNA epoxyqueuosine(34) reductase QueG [Acidobacteriaceae bacterium]
MQFTPELQDLIEKSAHARGFALCSVAAVPAAGSKEDAAERDYFAGWIAQGRGGEMGYLARADEQGSLLRSSLRVALPWAESVIVCAADYGAHAPLSIDPALPDAGWIARYAWSGDGEKNPTDYHEVMLENLRSVESVLHAQCGADTQTRCYVDTGPIVERTFARYAGIGWVGKNTCILNEQRGSWLFLGVIVTSLRLPPELTVAAAADRCGSCTRCIDACPTDALVAPRQMDASRCIAYLTIEKKGSVDEALRPLMGRQVFGCDICQDVCPWNAKAERMRPIQSSAAMTNEMQPREELINPPLDWLASLDPPEFKRLFRGSPLERTKLKGLRRNVAIAMGNSGDKKFLPQLDQWTHAEDETLRETAAWAFDRLK